jgi:hypothetical protein
LKLDLQGRYADCSDDRSTEVERLVGITRWCNGNTRDFGSLILGSNPSRVVSPLILVACTGQAKLVLHEFAKLG